ncbi:polysaccharide biosynthesis C-terminal domain-containing protein [Actinomadura sp. 9N407]|uniref:oligosaccharide flippase family protein n=1 Tax=Actinomadura sp. 9N407 TaxID=3375154 RepID=UPI0037AEF485
MTTSQTPPADLTRLARGGAINLVGAMCAGLMGFALIVTVARTYAPAVAGAFFAAMSLFIILNAVAGLGTDAGLLRWLPRHLALGARVSARRTVPIALVPVVATAFVAALALALAAPWLAGLIDSGGAGQATGMLRIMAVFLPVAAAQDALLAATRGYDSMRPTVLVDKIFRQVSQVGAVLVAYALSGGPEVLALAWSAPYVPGLIAAAVAYRGLSRRAGTRRAAAPADGDAELGPRELAGEFWRFTAPRSVAQICQTALQRSDIVLIAALSSPKDAAIYTAASRFVVFGQLAAQAVQQVMQPAVSRLLAIGDRDGAQRVLAVSSTWTVVITWPLYLALAVGAHTFLTIFSPEYAAEGQAATVILAVTMLLAAAVGPADVVLIMAGRSGLSLANNSVSLAVNLALNVVLIPVLGVTGAALARAAALATRNLLPLVQIRRLLGMGPSGAGLFTSIAYATVCFGMLSIVAQVGLGRNVFALLTGLVLGTAGYLALLWAGRERLALTAFKALVTRRRGGAHPPVAVTTPPEQTGAAHG